MSCFQQSLDKSLVHVGTQIVSHQPTAIGIAARQHRLASKNVRDRESATYCIPASDASQVP